MWKWETLSWSCWVAEEGYLPTSGWSRASTWHKRDRVRWHLPAEKLSWLALYFRYTGAVKIRYPSRFVLGCNLSLTRALNKMWVTGWQRNDLIALLWHAAMPHSVQDFFFFSSKLSKVTLSHFLDGRMLPSQMQSYCRCQCWCHWAPAPVQQGMQGCLKYFFFFSTWRPDITQYRHSPPRPQVVIFDKRECRETSVLSAGTIIAS